VSPHPCARVSRRVGRGVRAPLCEGAPTPGERCPCTPFARVEARSNLCAAVGVHQREAGSWSRSHKRAPRPQLMPPDARAPARRKCRACPDRVRDQRSRAAQACPRAGGELDHPYLGTRTSDRDRACDRVAPHRDRARRRTRRRSATPRLLGHRTRDRRDSAPPDDLVSIKLPTPHTQPSRSPSDEKLCGPDLTRPRCDREFVPLLWRNRRCGLWP
jgi:hypothetical protein